MPLSPCLLIVWGSSSCGRLHIVIGKWGIEQCTSKGSGTNRYICKLESKKKSQVHFILQLKYDLPEYLAAAEDVLDKVDFLKWWKSHENDRLPNCTRACRMIVLVQPSSAAAEHVFSMLNNSFSHQQESSLEDCLQLAVMLPYNYWKQDFKDSV